MDKFRGGVGDNIVKKIEIHTQWENGEMKFVKTYVQPVMDLQFLKTVYKWLKRFSTGILSSSDEQHRHGNG
ncbi:MAG: hypothetical protein AB2693_26535 [Candidatus Thiodiazotropha sp.]